MKSLRTLRFDREWFRGTAARLVAAAALLAIPALQNPTQALAAEYPCTAAGFQNAVTTGGVATFSCAAPTTITVGAFTPTVNADIDGGNLLTVQPTAANQRLFLINAGRNLKLRNMTLQNFSGNAAPGAVINVAAGGSFESFNVTYSKNSANGNQSGGALYSSGGVTVTGGLFDGNSATNEGGAIGTGATGTLAISDATFNNNTAHFGGAINTRVGAKIAATTFLSNGVSAGSPGAGVEGTALGGAINVTGTLTVMTSTFTANKAIAGGGFPGGPAKAYGGAIHFPISASGIVTITSSSFISNVVQANGAIGMAPGAADGKGGAVYAGDFGAPLTIYGSTFAYNSVTSAGANGQPAGSSAASGTGAGGAIFSYAGRTTIQNSTIYSNSVSATTNGSPAMAYGTADGGGISVEGAALGIFNSITVLDNRLTFNGVAGSGDGAGINVSVISSVGQFTNTVVARNTVSSGGAPTTENCTSPNANPAAVKSFGYNLSDDATCNFTTTGDAQSVPTATLNFGPLADNGGPTKTIEPLAGSPALDTGNTTCLPVDQRGAARPFGPKCDKGAMEAGASLPAGYRMFVPMVTPNTATTW